MTTVWRGEQFLERTRAGLVRGLNRAGIYFASKLRGYLNVSQRYRRYGGGKWYRGLNPSKPGEFPKKLSGQLQRSMTWEVDDSDLTLTVGSNLDGYPAYLEKGTRVMRPRPWLSRGFNMEKNQIGRLVFGG